MHGASSSSKNQIVLQYMVPYYQTCTLTLLWPLPISVMWMRDSIPTVSQQKPKYIMQLYLAMNLWFWQRYTFYKCKWPNSAMGIEVPSSSWCLKWITYYIARTFKHGFQKKWAVENIGVKWCQSYQRVYFVFQHNGLPIAKSTKSSITSSLTS